MRAIAVLSARGTYTYTTCYWILLALPLTQLSSSWTPLRNSDSTEVCISQLFLIPCKYHANWIMSDCGSSTYIHTHTFVRLAKVFRREELTHIARGALKKKEIFLQFFQKLCCWKGRKATVKQAYKQSNINPLIPSSEANPLILWKSPSLHLISFKCSSESYGSGQTWTCTAFGVGCTLGSHMSNRHIQSFQYNRSTEHFIKRMK